MCRVKFFLCVLLCFALMSCTPGISHDAVQQETTQSGHLEAEIGGSVTLKQCAEAGGSVVGDIGDGRIHRPDFRCPSGNKPIGSVRYEADQPIPTEGAVCCV